MLTVIEGIPAPLLVPRPMLSTGPAVNDPVMGEVPAIATEIIGQAPVTNGEAQLPPGLTFTQIIVNGNIYVWADSPESVSLPGNLAITDDGYTTSTTNGTFWYDYETGVVTLPTAIPNNVTVVAYRPITPYRTDKISTIPVALRDAVGQISIQYTLFSPPSVSSVTFLCRRNQISSTLSRFSATSPVNIDGHKYYPTQKSVVDSPVENKAAIAVGFESEFRNNPPRTNIDRAIKIKPMILGSGNSSSSAQYSTSQVAARSGTPYSGISVAVKVSKKIDSNATTTLRQLLSTERLAVVGAFLRLDRNAVEVASWYNVATHTIDLSELKGGDKAIPAINYNGSGAMINGVPLLVELRNAEIQLDKSVDEDIPGDKRETKVSGDPNPTSPPTEGYYAFNSDKLRSPSLAFDNGGPTKKKITTELLNGQPTEEREEYYGFIYNSKDVYEYSVQTLGGRQRANIFFSGGDPDSLWRKFKTVEKRYVYDSEGYLTRIITTVDAIQRILKESDQLEAISGLANYAVTDVGSSVKKDYEAQGYWFNGNGLYDFGGSGGGSGNVIATSYSPQSGTTDGDVLADLTTSLAFNPEQSYVITESRELAAMSDYYDDIDRPNEEDDPQWIPPRFIETRTITESGVQIVEDPRRTQKKRNPPIVFGKESTQIEKTEILSAKDPEVFKVTQVLTNKEGEQLQDTVTESQFSQQSGRPSQAERLVRYGRSPRNQRDENEPRITYLATTSGAPSGGDGITQSLSFPGAETIGQASTALKLWLLIQNLDAATTSLTLNNERTELRTGDKVIYNGKNWRIKSIRNNKEIGSTQRQLDFTVELGFDFGNIPFGIQQIREPVGRSGARTGSIAI